VDALADAILVAHFAYVLFVVGGLLLIWLGCAAGWRWVRNWWFRVLHLAAISLVAVEAVIGLACPLTVIEDVLRPGAASRQGFVERWIHALMFFDWPAWVFTSAYLAFTAAVAVTFAVLPPAPRSQR
jgi:uncharacterized protein DUF2784